MSIKYIIEKITIEPREMKLKKGWKLKKNPDGSIELYFKYEVGMGRGK